MHISKNILDEIKNGYKLYLAKLSSDSKKKHSKKIKNAKL